MADNLVTPMKLLALAEHLSYRLLGLTELQKSIELRRLKEKNSVLFSLVTSNIRQIRGDAQSG